MFEREFAAIKPISIDYAVMEHATDVAVIEAPFEWDDLGGWQSLARLVGSDENGNTIVGRHLGLDTSGTIVRTDDDHLVVTLGLKDCIVVHTPNATLVANKHSEEQIRQVVKQLEELGLVGVLVRLSTAKSTRPAGTRYLVARMSWRIQLQIMNRRRFCAAVYRDRCSAARPLFAEPDDDAKADDVEKQVADLMNLMNQNRRRQAVLGRCVVLPRLAHPVPRARRAITGCSTARITATRRARSKSAATSWMRSASATSCRRWKARRSSCCTACSARGRP